MVNEINLGRAMARVTVSISVAKSSEVKVGDVFYVNGVIGSCEELLDKNRNPYYVLSVSDSTGMFQTKVWSNQMINPQTGTRILFERGSVYMIRLKKGIFDGKEQLNYDDSIILADTFDDLARYTPGESSVEKYRDELIESISKVYDVNFGLVKRFFESAGKLPSKHFEIFKEVFRMRHSETYNPDEDTVPILDGLESLSNHFKDSVGKDNFRKFVTAPAGKSMHGSFIHGLLVHSMTLHDAAEGMEKVYSGERSYPKNSFEKIDWMSIKLMALIHDFFKIDEYEWESYGNISMADMSTMYSHSMRMFSLLEDIKLRKAKPVPDNSIEPESSTNEQKRAIFGIGKALGLDDKDSIKEKYNIESIAALSYMEAQSIITKMKIDLGEYDGDTEDWATLIHRLQQIALLHHGQWSEWKIGQYDTLFVETEVFHSLDLMDSRIAGVIEK